MRMASAPWILCVALLLFGCSGVDDSRKAVSISRESRIPADALKITAETDAFPPLMHSDGWERPVPLGLPIDTPGAEDSPFITPDGGTLYFFFTPDPGVAPEKQLTDGVTGIYVSKKAGNAWTRPERVVLSDPGRLALDGCAFESDGTLWFCSAREGNIRGVDLWSADFRDGTWTGWKNAGTKLNGDYGVGEMHITADGKEMFFHSERPGGQGGLDIWVTRYADGEWQEPEDVPGVNSPENEGWPFLSQDGRELWFLRTYQGSPGIFRSERTDGSWSEPELVISQFAAEPSLDKDGNIYFAHHFFKDGKMVESDIYVAYKR
ncbi:MAG: hypothetical protein U0R44_07300 [Candidatus Micrarchaeia archaeon]